MLSANLILAVCRIYSGTLLYGITCNLVIECFSNECRKTKTKVITPANHDKHKLPNEPIRT